MDFPQLLQYCLYDRDLANYFSRKLGIALPKPEPFNPEFARALKKLRNPICFHQRVISEMYRTSHSFAEKKCTIEHAFNHRMDQDFFVILNCEMADLAVTFKEKLLVWNDSLRIMLPDFVGYQITHRMQQELIQTGTLTDWIVAYKFFHSSYPELFRDIAQSQIIYLLQNKADEIPLAPPPALETDPTYGYEFYPFKF